MLGAATAAAAATSLFGAGWGSPASAAPSRASYGSLANAVCGAFNAKLATLTDSLATATSITQAERQLGLVITTSLQDNRALEAIRRPPAEAKALGELFAMQGKQIADLRRAVSSLQHDSVVGVSKDLKADQALIKPVERRFNALGLTACAAQPSAAGSTAG